MDSSELLIRRLLSMELIAIGIDDGEAVVFTSGSRSMSLTSDELHLLQRMAGRA